jgi:segregation and condensation protein A
MSYKVNLPIFEGPLDLLLFLIKKDEVDIYDIPIAKITAEYVEYMEMLQKFDLDLAGEFLVMAATLMHIKSKMLLPKPIVEEEQIEADPREELVQRLLEYKKFKDAAGSLGDMEKQRKQMSPRRAKPDLDNIMMEDYAFDDGQEASIFSLITAFVKVVKDFSHEDVHKVVEDEYTVSEKIHDLYHMLVDDKVIYFTQLFEKANTKLEAITIFLAILELIKLNEIIVTQHDAFSEIEIRQNPDVVKNDLEKQDATEDDSENINQQEIVDND